jgi:tetratricopeptide (TPR) repeat protein
MKEKLAADRSRLWLKICFFLCMIVLQAGHLPGQILNAYDNFLLGSAKLKCLACEHAVSDFSEAIKLDNKFANAYYGRSLAYLCLDEYDQAIQDIDQAIRLNGNEVLYRECKGRIRTAAGDIAGGNRDFQAAIRQDSLCWQAWYGWARNEHSQKEYTKARMAYGETIDLNPDFAMAWMGRGELEEEVGDMRNALSDIDSAIARSNVYAPMFEVRSKIYLNMERWSESIDDATTSIRLDPTLPLSWYYRGKAKMALESYTEADKDFEEALKLNKRLSDANFLRGLCHERVNDLSGAKKYYTKAVKKDRTHKLAYISRANVWIKLEKKKKAVQDLDKALFLDKDDVVLLIRRGFLFMDLEENQSAIDDFSQAMLIAPENGEAHYGMGNATYAEGNVRKACDDWRNALHFGEERAGPKLSQYCVE